MKEADRRRTILTRLASMAPTARPAAPIPTGFASLDASLGGGLPRRRIVEIFGPAGCGKTTLGIQVAAHLQRAGLTAAWIDADHAFDAAYAARLGAEMSRLPLSQPQSAEQALEIARALAGSGAVDLVVVDSAAALVPGIELAIGASAPPGLHSRVMASGLRRLSNTLARSDACALFLNQMRNRPDQAGGETSAGGAPLKIHAAVRLMLIPSSGSRIMLRPLKNKAAERIGGRELEWRRDAGFVESP